MQYGALPLVRCLALGWKIYHILQVHSHNLFFYNTHSQQMTALPELELLHET